ncbi:hypothetical protein PF003_g3054 [Phytophthora fragariae]|nr:hypothetical protein PF003_g3054 [Phytophthora fragariae]
MGTKLLMQTAAHPETDGQTEQVFRSYAISFASLSTFMPLPEFALNNAVHASKGLTPFFAQQPAPSARLSSRRRGPPQGTTLGMTCTT